LPLKKSVAGDSFARAGMNGFQTLTQADFDTIARSPARRSCGHAGTGGKLPGKGGQSPGCLPALGACLPGRLPSPACGVRASAGAGDHPKPRQPEHHRRRDTVITHLGPPRSMALDTSIVRSQARLNAQPPSNGVARSPRSIEKSRFLVQDYPKDREYRRLKLSQQIVLA
jgi:hypothetical protein